MEYKLCENLGYNNLFDDFAEKKARKLILLHT